MTTKPRSVNASKGLPVNHCSGFCLLTTTNNSSPDGFSRENFSIEVNAQDHDFEPTETPRTDRPVMKNVELGLAALSCKKGPTYDRIILNAGMVDHLLECRGAENVQTAFKRVREAITNDYCAIPLTLKDQVSERYPGARRAILKTGGDFPFLSRPDEVNLYLQLHLRRVGVEVKPEHISGISKDGSAGNLHDSKGGEHEDSLPESQGSYESHYGSHEPQPSGSGQDNDGDAHEDGPSEDRGSSGSRDSCHEPQALGFNTCNLDEELLTCASINALALVVTPLLVQASSILMVQLNFGGMYTARMC